LFEAFNSPNSSEVLPKKLDVVCAPEFETNVPTNAPPRYLSSVRLALAKVKQRKCVRPKGSKDLLCLERVWRRFHYAKIVAWRASEKVLTGPTARCIGEVGKEGEKVS
jgi:hypothetical protein